MKIFPFFVFPQGARTLDAPPSQGGGGCNSNLSSIFSFAPAVFVKRTMRLATETIVAERTSPFATIACCFSYCPTNKAQYYNKKDKSHMILIADYYLMRRSSRTRLGYFRMLSSFIKCAIQIAAITKQQKNE